MGHMDLDEPRNDGRAEGGALVLMRRLSHLHAHLSSLIASVSTQITVRLSRLREVAVHRCCKQMCVVPVTCRCACGRLSRRVLHAPLWVRCRDRA
eukprot:154887-Prymnesium_polylepis.4